jgi:hypothetical protein
MNGMPETQLPDPGLAWVLCRGIGESDGVILNLLLEIRTASWCPDRSRVKIGFLGVLHRSFPLLMYQFYQILSGLLDHYKNITVSLRILNF